MKNTLNFQSRIMHFSPAFLLVHSVISDSIPMFDFIWKSIAEGDTKPKCFGGKQKFPLINA